MRVREPRSPSPHHPPKKVGLVRLDSTYLGSKIAVLIISGLFSANLWAQEPLDQSDFFGQFLAEFLEHNPATRESGYSVMESPVFHQAFSSALLAREMENLQLPQSTASLMEEGSCTPRVCKVLTENADSKSAFRSLSLLPVAVGKLADGRTSIELRWTMSPGPGAHANPNQISPTSYEILVIDQGQYRRYEVNGTESVGHPRTFSRVADSDLRAGQAMRYAQRERRTRQSARLVLDAIDAGEVFVRARYGNGSLSAGVHDKREQGHAAGDSLPVREQSAESWSLPSRVSSATPSAIDHEKSYSSSALSNCISANRNQQKVKFPSQLTSLDCTSYGISSLTGIEDLTNLQVLILDQNPVADLGPVASLLNLEVLSLVGTDVTSLMEIAALDHVRSINVSGTAVTSLDHVVDFPNLENITALSAPISRVPDLSGTSLKVILLGGSLVTDISGLANVASLETVSLVSTPVGDINALVANAEMTSSQLGKIDLTGNSTLYCAQLDDLEALVGGQSSEGSGLLRPSSCSDLPVPQSLSSSANPSFGREFTLTWTTPSPVSGSAHVRISHSQDRGRSFGSFVSTEFYVESYQNKDLKLPYDTHTYQVQICVDSGSVTHCSGPSEQLDVALFANPDQTVDDALQAMTAANAHPALISCLQDASAGHSTVGFVEYADCSLRGIDTVIGIGEFVSLRDLRLSNNQIELLGPLSELPQLEHLYLDTNIVSSGSELFALTGEERNFLVLDLSANQLPTIEPLNDIGNPDPRGAPLIQSLYVGGNLLTEIPELRGVVDLYADSNLIESAPGFCAQGQCALQESMSSTLLNLSLIGNPLDEGDPIWAHMENLEILEALGVAQTQLQTLEPITSSQALSSLRALDVSYNSILELGDLGALPLLHTLNVSGLNIAKVNDGVGPGGELPGNALVLPVLSNLEHLYLHDASLLYSVGRISEFSSLNTLSISNSILGQCEHEGYDPAKSQPALARRCESLEFVNDMPGFWRITLSGNGVSNLAPVREFLDTNGLWTSRLQVMFNLVGELSIVCSEADQTVAPIVALPQSCLPNPPEPGRFVVANSYEEATVGWSQLTGALPDYLVLRTIGSIGVEESQGSPEFAQAQIDPAILSRDETLAVEILSCTRATPPACSPPSTHRFASLPLVAPRDVIVDVFQSGGQELADLEWSYPVSTPQDALEIQFELQQVIGGSGPVVSPAPFDQNWFSDIETGQFAGRLAHLRACRGDGAIQECGAASLVAMRGLGGGSAPAPVQGLVLRSGASASDSVQELTWGHELHDQGDIYYRITEADEAGVVSHEYVIQELKMARRRFEIDSGLYDYRVQACRNVAGNEACSPYTAVEASAEQSAYQYAVPLPPPSTPLRTNVCWFGAVLHVPGRGHYVNLRWSYEPVGPNGESLDTPSVFEVQVPSQFGGFTDSGTVRYHDAKYAIDDDGRVHEYWEASSVRVSDTTNGIEPWDIRIDPRTPGQALQSGDETVPIRPIVEDSSAPGGGAGDELLKCGDLPTGANRTAGGPDQLKPGHWTSDAQPRQGWRFFWTNEARFDELNEAFGPVYSLIGIWYTYKKIDTEWTPVWYYSRMKYEEDQSGNQFFTGALHYPTKDNQDPTVGTVSVLLENAGATSGFRSPTILSGDSNLSATVQIRQMNDGDGQVHPSNHEVQIEDIRQAISGFNPFIGDNPSRKWNGVWTEGPLFSLVNGFAQVNDLFIVEWIAGNAFSSAVNTFDAQGQPIWFLNFKHNCGDPPACDPGQMPDYGDSHGHIGNGLDQGPLTVEPGFNPFVDFSGEVFDETFWVGKEHFVTGPLHRRYIGTSEPHEGDHLEGFLCGNWQLPPAIQARGLWPGVLDDASCDQGLSVRRYMRKVAGLHHFDFQILGQDSCDLALGSCELSLTWFTDDYYLNATPFVEQFVPGDGTQQSQWVQSDLSSNCLNEVSFDPEAFAVYEVSCIWDQEGDLRFTLLSEPGGTPLATSRMLEIDPPGTGPSGPEILTDPIAVLGANPVPHDDGIGATQGDFSVSQGGAAQFTIPVMVARGRGNMAPQLSLRFSSQSGVGHAGEDWSLSGFSTITRCAQTIAQDGQTLPVSLDNDADRFCLDGQRLIAVPGSTYGADGSEYRLEINDHRRIFFVNDGPSGPSYFIVQAKDGTNTIYGSSPLSIGDSSAYIEAIRSDTTSVAFAWPVSRIEDSAGNYIEFSYSHPGPDWIEWLPDSVRYTGNTNTNDPTHALIDFDWEDRGLSPTQLEEQATYVAGQKLRHTQRLQSISSLDGGLLLRKYELSYNAGSRQQDLLASVSECWDDAGSLSCFNAPTSFTWNDATLTGGSTDLLSSSILNFQSAQVGDIDGDGRDEIVFLGEKAITIGGIQQDRAVFGYYEAIESGGTLSVRLFGESQVIQGSELRAIEVAALGWQLADLSGNGRMGVVFAKRQIQSPPRIDVFFKPWSETGFGGERTIGSITAASDGLEGQIADKLSVSASDIDGDGLSDVLMLIGDPDLQIQEDQIPGWYWKNPNNRNVLWGNWEDPTALRIPVLAPEVYGDCDNNPQQVEYGFEASIHVASPISVDGSGRAGVIMAVTYQKECLQSPSGFFQEGWIAVDRASLEQSRGIGGGNYTIEVERSGVWQLTQEDGSVPDERLLEHAVALDFGEDDRVLPFDWSLDGLTDFAVVTEEEATEKTLVSVRLNAGRDSAESLPLELVDDPDLVFRHPVNFNKRRFIRVTDVTGDGYPELVMPSTIVTGDGRKIEVFPWPWQSDTNGDLTGSEFLGGTSDLHFDGSQDTSFEQIIFWDAAGNGRPSPGVLGEFSDNHRLEWVENSAVDTNGALDRFAARQALTAIVDGLGSTTNIEYLPLSSRAVYRRDTGNEWAADTDPEGAIYDLIQPHFVVSRATSSAPGYRILNPTDVTLSSYESDQVSEVRYYYTGAKMQGRGRGSLGFRQMATYEPESRVATVSEYYQGFPLTGHPKSSTRYYIKNGEPWETEHDLGPLSLCTFACDEEFFHREVGSNGLLVTNSNLVVLGDSETVWSEYWGESGLDTGTTDVYAHVYPARIDEVSYSANTNSLGTAILSSVPVKRTETLIETLGGVERAGTPADFPVDDFGNVLESHVTTMAWTGGGWTEYATKSIENRFLTGASFIEPAGGSVSAGNSPLWWAGRLSCTLTRTERPGSPGSGPAIYRASAFGYKIAPETNPNGVLNAEYSGQDLSGGPDAQNWCAQASSNHEVETRYELDPYGNRVETITRFKEPNEAGLTGIRGQKSTWSGGRYIVARAILDDGIHDGVAEPDPENADHWRVVETITERNRYGDIERSQDALSNTTEAVFSPRGLPRAVALETGDITYMGLASPAAVAGCPAQTAFVEISQKPEGSYGYSCKDLLGREVRAATRSFARTVAEAPIALVDTYYDYQSRPIAGSEPYYDPSLSAAHCASHEDLTCLADPLLSRNLYDPVGRVHRMAVPTFDVNQPLNPAGQETRTISYSGLETTTIDEAGFETSVLENVMGEKIREVRPDTGSSEFFHDAIGQLVRVNGPRSAPDDDIIVIDYDHLGNKISVNDPDKGLWYYRYDALGNLVCQQDAEDNLTSVVYDELGRMRERRTRQEASCQSPAGGAFEQESTWAYVGPLLVSESTTDQTSLTTGLEEVTVDRSFEYDTQFSRLIATTTEVRERSNGVTQTQPYVESQTYDRYGRTFQIFDASGNNRGVMLQYSATGHVLRTMDARYLLSDAPEFHRTLAVDARGNIIKSALGFEGDPGGAWTASVVQERQYDPATGEMTFNGDLSGANQYVKLHMYQWDRIGNLTKRSDLSDLNWQVHEFFEYDLASGRRLAATWRSPTGLGMPGAPDDDWSKVAATEYDGVGVGNLTCKAVQCGGLETHRYGEAHGQNPPGPHALTSFWDEAAAGWQKLRYDNVGNMIAHEEVGGAILRAIEYSAFNKVRQINTPSETATTSFGYDAQRSRIVKWHTVAGSTVRTHYIGSVEFEYEAIDAGNSAYTEARRRVAGVAIETLENYGTSVNSRLRFTLTDHQGSIVALTNAAGQIVARMSFDAWGVRRDPQTASPWISWDATGTPAWAETFLEVTPRGYTGHEHEDAHGIINMNGRIYDPVLARFLQADPFMEDEVTLNRYTYVHNNPLAFTDPSGYSSWKDWVRVGLAIAIGVITQNYAVTLESIAAAIAVGAAGGFAAGYVATGTWEGALAGAFTGAVLGGVSNYLSNSPGSWAVQNGKLTTAGRMTKYLTPGVASGIGSEIQGGRFGHGFTASLLGSTLGSAASSAGDEGLSFVLSSIAGGTVSSITGGKFANGAVASAFGFAFSANTSQGSSEVDSKDWLEMTYEEQVAHLESKGFYETDTMLAECIGCAAQDRWIRALGAGQITEDQYWANFNAQGSGALTALSMLVPGGGFARATQLGFRAGRNLARGLGPYSRAFGTSYYRGRGLAGFLNNRSIRIGWSFNAKTNELNFVLRIGKSHSDRIFNPISMGRNYPAKKF